MKSEKAEHILKILNQRDREVLLKRKRQQVPDATAPPDNAESPLLKELSEWQNMENHALKRE